jgi:hypothetical protein
LGRFCQGGFFWWDSLKKLDIFMYLYYVEFSFFKSVFMTQTIGEAFREAVLALSSDLSPEKRRGEIAKILDQFTDDGDENIVLNNADLSNLDLQEVDFSEEDLSGANLMGTDLREACFHDTNLNNAQMDDATQLSGAIGLLKGWEDQDGDRQTNTINITPKVQFPDDVVEAFRNALKNNQNFWADYQTDGSSVKVSVEKLTLKISEGDFQTFQDSIQNQIRTYRIKKFVQKVRDLGHPEQNITSGSECVSDISERIKILNNLINDLRDQDGIFDIAGADLSGLDLRGLDLHDTNFTGCNLSRADLRGSNLEGADLANHTEDDTTQWPQNYEFSGAVRG